MSINVLSIFDGISCGRLALQKAGIEVGRYYSSEIDKFAIKCANDNWPQDEEYRLGDVTTINGGDLPKIDLLMGGSPCQGFSFAGKQLNFEDPRSKLFFEFVRLIKECEPKYFLLENVRMKEESKNVITDMLGVEPIEINSSLVSAQNRRRLYWTNIPNVKQPDDLEIYLKDIILHGIVDREKSYCIDANYYKGGSLKNYLEKCRRQLVFYFEKDTSYRMLTPIECERLQTVPDNYTSILSNTQRYKTLGNGWTVDVIAHILSFMKMDIDKNE